MKKVIGLDIGGTNCRAAIINENYQIEKILIKDTLRGDKNLFIKQVIDLIKEIGFNEEIIELECDMSYSYSLKNGVYQLQLNSDNSPYPMIQYYSFEVHEWVQEGEFEVTLDY